MSRRSLARFFLAAALCAATAPALAVTIPWSDEPERRSGQIDIPLSLQSLSDALASTGATGLDRLGGDRPQAGYAALAALVRAALEKMPWLGGADRENGLWTWRRNPAQGIAIYGPGVGGYSSFSWGKPPLPPAPVATTQKTQRWIPVTYQQKAANSVLPAPAPVPLPTGGGLLMASLLALAVLRRRQNAPD
jgi:hypothetical protein